MSDSSYSYRSYVSDAKRSEMDYGPVLGRLALSPKGLRLLHVALGVAGEAGELVDAVKKHVFYGQPLDTANLHEECGDLFWFLALLADTLGEANFTSMLRANIEKLRARYPEKYSDDHAASRLDKLAAEPQP